MALKNITTQNPEPAQKILGEEKAYLRLKNPLNSWRATLMRDKPVQSGTRREKQGQKGNAPVCPCLSLFVPACPCLSLHCPWHWLAWLVNSHWIGSKYDKSCPIYDWICPKYDEICPKYGFVQHMTGYVLNMTGFDLIMTGFVINIIEFFLNMTG